MIKVIVADDQELIRQSLEIVLSGQADIEVIAMAADGREVLRCLEREQPDIILMDVRMPGMDGVKCTQEVKQSYPAVRIIILTTFDDDEYVFAALKYGASGYLLKGVPMDQLCQSIRTVYGGGSLMTPDIASKVFREFSKLANAEPEPAIRVAKERFRELSENEWAIIQEIRQGLSNKEIARKLNFSEGTVRNYISTVLSKLQLRDRTQLAIWAVHAPRPEEGQ